MRGLEVLPAHGLYLDRVAPAFLWKLTERDLTLQQVVVSSHPGFKNHESAPLMTQEAKKAPDLERYVGGYVCLLVFQPVHIIKPFSTNTRARHVGTDSHISVGHLCSNDFTKAESLNMTFAY